MRRLLPRLVTVLAVLYWVCAAMAQDAEWVPVTGADAVRDVVSGLTAERELPSGEIARGEYAADGTGVVHAWGASVPRTWSVEGEDRLGITAQRETLCYQRERNAADDNLYRALAVATGEVTEFRLSDKVASTGGEAGNQGGVAEPSAAELAAELANPNTSVATLTHIDECNKKVQNRHQVAGSFGDLNSCLVKTNRVERVIILRAVGLDRTTAFNYLVHLDELHG